MIGRVLSPMLLVSAGWTPVRHDFLLRGIVRGTTEPHKLKQAGATPAPATSFPHPSGSIGGLLISRPVRAYALNGDNSPASESRALISQSPCQRGPVNPVPSPGMSGRWDRRVGVHPAATVGAGNPFRVSPRRVSLITPTSPGNVVLIGRLLPWLARVFFGLIPSRVLTYPAWGVSSSNRVNRRRHRLAFFLAVSRSFHRQP